MYVGSTGDGTPGQFFFFFMIAPICVSVLFAGWWLLFSRLHFVDRLLALAVFFACGAATLLISPKTFPMMALILYALPVLLSIWVGWLLVSIPIAWPARRLGLLAAIVLAWIPCNSLRVDGMDGRFKPRSAGAGLPTAEERMLLHVARRCAKSPAAETRPPRPDASASAPAEIVGSNSPRRLARLSRRGPRRPTVRRRDRHRLDKRRRRANCGGT